MLVQCLERGAGKILSHCNAAARYENLGRKGGQVKSGRSMSAERRDCAAMAGHAGLRRPPSMVRHSRARRATGRSLLAPGTGDTYGRPMIPHGEPPDQAYLKGQASAVQTTAGPAGTQSIRPERESPPPLRYVNPRPAHWPLPAPLAPAAQSPLPPPRSATCSSAPASAISIRAGPGPASAPPPPHAGGCRSGRHP